RLLARTPRLHAERTAGRARRRERLVEVTPPKRCALPPGGDAGGPAEPDPRRPRLGISGSCGVVYGCLTPTGCQTPTETPAAYAINLCLSRQICLPAARAQIYCAAPGPARYAALSAI